jgi:hypothetical protein
VLLLSIPRVRLDKRLGSIDDSFHATTIGLDAFHVHAVDTFGEFVSRLRGAGGSLLILGAGIRGQPSIFHFCSRGYS